MKLTDNQRAALQHIADQQITNRRCGTAAWRIFGPSHPTVVGRVISLGLARWANGGDGIEIAQLTETGKAAL